MQIYDFTCSGLFSHLIDSFHALKPCKIGLASFLRSIKLFLLLACLSKWVRVAQQLRTLIEKKGSSSSRTTCLFFPSWTRLFAKKPHRSNDEIARKPLSLPNCVAAVVVGKRKRRSSWKRVRHGRMSPRGLIPGLEDPRFQGYHGKKARAGVASTSILPPHLTGRISEVESAWGKMEKHPTEDVSNQ